MIAQDKHWMLIYFSATLFTPKGMEVLSDGHDLNRSDWEAIYIAIDNHPTLMRLESALQLLDRSDC